MKKFVDVKHAVERRKVGRVTLATYSKTKYATIVSKECYSDVILYHSRFGKASPMYNLR